MWVVVAYRGNLEVVHRNWYNVFKDKCMLLKESDNYRELVNWVLSLKPQSC